MIGLAPAGALIKVAPGFARNYLIPKGIAVYATPENVAKYKLDEALLQAVSQRRKKGYLFTP